MQVARNFTRLALSQQTALPSLASRLQFSKINQSSSNAHSESIPKPQNPTMAESFGTKIRTDDLEKLMDPTGFLKEADRHEYEGIDKEGHVKQPDAESIQKAKAEAANKKMAPEFGFKVKGPEPTRYGDWERKGRCTDFWEVP